MMCQTTKESLRRRMVSLERWDAPKLSLPRREVQDFFEANDGKRILDLTNCTCGVFRGCASRHHPFDKAAIRRIRDPEDPYIVVLGFLCYVEHTGLIHRFLEEGYSDKWLHTNELKRAQLDRLFGSPESGGKADSHIEFDIQLFFMPIIHGPAEQQSFSPMRTLPYTVGKRVGGGGYGNVYPAKILDGGYFAFPDDAEVDSLPDFPQRDRADRRQDRHVAIKHYTCTAAYNARADWEKEWENNLMYKHPHIVPILASVAQGEVYMNFYPLCEQDLHTLFNEDRRPEHDPKSVWRQFMRLLSALRHVHYGHHGRFGYHFDIKCQNILVCKGKWMIADLGIAHSKSDGIGTSLTRRRPGPEEFGGPEARVTRKFDIWGIACVGCIVFAWLLDGAGGVSQFREDRKVAISESDGPTSTLYNFFQRVGPDTVIHPAVEALFSKTNDPISKGVAAILKDMLSINVDMRPTAEEAEKRFGKVLGVAPLELPRVAGIVSTQTLHVPRTPLKSRKQRSAQLSVPISEVPVPRRQQHCRLSLTTLLLLPGANRSQHEHQPSATKPPWPKFPQEMATSCPAENFQAPISSPPGGLPAAPTEHLPSRLRSWQWCQTMTAAATANLPMAPAVKTQCHSYLVPGPAERDWTPITTLTARS